MLSLSAQAAWKGHVSVQWEGASCNPRRVPLLPPALLHTDHRPPASTSMRKYVSADQTTEAVVVCYGSPGRQLSRYDIAVCRVHCGLLSSGLISTPAFDDCSLPRGLADSGAASPPFWCPWHPSLVSLVGAHASSTALACRMQRCRPRSGWAWQGAELSISPAESAHQLVSYSCVSTFQGHHSSSPKACCTAGLRTAFLKSCFHALAYPAGRLCLIFLLPEVMSNPQGLCL